MFIKRLALLPLALFLMGAAPYDTSTYLTDLTLTWSSHDEIDCNTDNWPVTWHDDNNLYMTFGDGCGIEGSPPGTPTSFGVARITGTWASYSANNVFGGNSPTCSYDNSFNGKSRSMASINGKLYAWWSNASGTNVYDRQELIWSDDDGCTWTKHGTNAIDNWTDVHSGHIVNCEQGGDQDCGDGYVYEVWVHTYDTGSLGIQTGGSPNAGRLHLSRVADANFETYSSREWFSGTSGSPAWSSNDNDKTEIFVDTNGTGWNSSMSYISALDRYILATEHTYSGVGADGSEGGCLGIYESENPYGPWSTVKWWSCTGNDYFGYNQSSMASSTFFLDIPLKWVEGDVATSGDFILFFTGTGTVDSWNAIEASFNVVPVEGPGGRLDPAEVSYLGYFLPPTDQGGTNADKWTYGVNGLTLIPDCMGEVDPSPDDGYPGCLGAHGHSNGHRFGVMDLVPPDSQRASQVVAFYDVGSGVPESQICGSGSCQFFEVYYDDSETPCRLWWTYANNYAGVEDDDPYLGVSSCTPGSPGTPTIYDVGAEFGGDKQDDPYHTAKMYHGLGKIPQGTADEHFDGKQMWLGYGRRSGTRGGSQGPSLWVRPMTDPVSNPILDSTPLLWYLLTGFMEWYDTPEMSGPIVNWWSKSWAVSGEFVRSGTNEAVIMIWREPVIDVNDYPCSDPSAYRSGDPEPVACEVPVCWYGVEECQDGPAEEQQPSFWEDDNLGATMPKDCNLSDPCTGGTGPRCLSVEPFLLFYDPADLADVYSGGETHDYPQPYAKTNIRDLFVGGTTCLEEISGTTYDQANQLYYAAQSGSDPVIHVFEIAEVAAAEGFGMVLTGNLSSGVDIQ